MKLFSPPKARATALAGIPDIATGVELLGKLTRQWRAGRGFEIMPKTYGCGVKTFSNIPPLDPIPDFMIDEFASRMRVTGQKMQQDAYRFWKHWKNFWQIVLKLA